VAGVAHDFNNTLATLRGNLELIELDPAHSQAYLKEAVSAVHRAAERTSSWSPPGARRGARARRRTRWA
jgi:hypothetical protein